MADATRIRRRQYDENIKLVDMVRTYKTLSFDILLDQFGTPDATPIEARKRIQRKLSYLCSAKVLTRTNQDGAPFYSLGERAASVVRVPVQKPADINAKRQQRRAAAREAAKEAPPDAYVPQLVPARADNMFERPLYQPEPGQAYYRNNGNKHIRSAGVGC